MWITFTVTWLMSTLGAGPVLSLSAHHCRLGPGVPSREDMALVLVLSPGDMFCTGVGPLGYLNLLLAVPPLAPGLLLLLLLAWLLLPPTDDSPAAGEGWGLGKLKPA